MARFARLFELPNENQLLLTIQYSGDKEAEAEFEVKAQSEINGVIASVTFGFHSEDEAQDMLENFSIDDAKNYRNNLMNVLN